MKQLVDFIFDGVIANLVKFLCAVLVLVILLQIGARFFMDHPFSWTEEFSRLIFIWFCMLSGTITLKKNLHIGIDYVYLKLKGFTRIVFDLSIYSLILIFGMILLIYGIRLLGIVSGQTTEMLRWPSAVYYSSVPLVGALYILFCINKILEIFSCKGVTR